MALDIIQDTSQIVRYEAADLPARPASATLAFRNPGGTTLATPSVSLTAVGSGGFATVSSVTSQTVMVVSNATGLSPGSRAWMETADGWSGAVRVSEEASRTVTLEAAPPGTVTTAAKLYPIELSATIPASATGTRDKHYRIEWTITDADGTAHKRQTMAHVCAMGFRDAITSDEVARYMAATFPGYAAGLDAGQFTELARRASGRVRRLLQAEGTYPHLVGDQDAFVDVGLVALRVELALAEALVPAGYEPSQYVADTERALKVAMGEALASNWVDRDDDQSVDEGDLRNAFAVRAVRV